MTPFMKLHGQNVQAWAKKKKSRIKLLREYLYAKRLKAKLERGLSKSSKVRAERENLRIQDVHTQYLIARENLRKGSDQYGITRKEAA